MSLYQILKNKGVTLSTFQITSVANFLETRLEYHLFETGLCSCIRESLYTLNNSRISDEDRGDLQGAMLQYVQARHTRYGFYDITCERWINSTPKERYEIRKAKIQFLIEGLRGLL